MPLKYALYKDDRSDDPNAYKAKVIPNGIKTTEDIIDMMLKNNPNLEREKVRALIQAFEDVVIERLSQGYSISTPLGDFHPPAQQEAHGVDDPFSAGRPAPAATFTPGAWLQDVEAKIELERVSADDPTPDPEDFEDVMSEACNTVATPGGLARLQGSRLKYEPEDPAQGIFFIGVNTETRVERLMQNERGVLLFVIPPTLASGSYTVEVRARLEEVGAVRTGMLPNPLQVR